MEKNLDILVVEDKKIHQKSAKLLEKEGHNVDLAVSFFDAARMLGYHKRVAKRYDAVLTDMMLTFGGKRHDIATFRNELERNEENPLGYAIVLYAARQNVPLIAVLTDMNHHSGPVAGTFDLFYTDHRKRPSFRINDSKVMMFDERDLEQLYMRSNGTLTSKYKYGLETVKNWVAALKELQKDENELQTVNRGR